MLNAALYNEVSSSTASVEPAAVVPMTNLRLIGSDLSFDAASNAITASTSGTYLFLWHVSGTLPAAGALMISLSSADGGTAYALSGVSTTTDNLPQTLSGSTVLALTAGDSLTLRNQSSAALTLLPLNGEDDRQYTSSLTAVRVG